MVKIPQGHSPKHALSTMSLCVMTASFSEWSQPLHSTSPSSPAPLKCHQTQINIQWFPSYVSLLVLISLVLCFFLFYFNPILFFYLIFTQVLPFCLARALLSCSCCYLSITYPCAANIFHIERGEVTANKIYLRVSMK